MGIKVLQNTINPEEDSEKEKDKNRKIHKTVEIIPNISINSNGKCDHLKQSC